MAYYWSKALPPAAAKLLKNGRGPQKTNFQNLADARREYLQLTELEKDGPRGIALRTDINGYLDANESVSMSTSGSSNTPSDAELASTVSAGGDSGLAVAEQTGDMLARALGAAGGRNLLPQRIAALERTTRRLLERCSHSKGSALTHDLCTAKREARVPLPALSEPSMSSAARLNTAPLALAGGGSGGGGLNGLASPTGNGHAVPATTDATAYATVVDLAPDAFRCVRLAFGYTFEAFAESLGSAPLIPVGAGGGRSGASFYYSHDKLFVVKTLPEPEKVFLLTLLSSYVDHMCTHAAYTLLPRFLGLYKVRWVVDLLQPIQVCYTE